MLKNGEKVRAKVLLKEPKCTGGSEVGLNINIVGKEQSSSVNWEEALWLKETESEHILILSEVNENSQEFLDAKQREMSSLKKKTVRVTGLKIWSEKQKENGSKMLRSRLVAWGS